MVSFSYHFQIKLNCLFIIDKIHIILSHLNHYVQLIFNGLRSFILFDIIHTKQILRLICVTLYSQGVCVTV